MKTFFFITNNWNGAGWLMLSENDRRQLKKGV